MQKKKPLRQYSPAEREEGIRAYLALGAKAAEKLGIPMGTLSCWVHLARKEGRVPAPEGTASPAQVQSPPPAEPVAEARPDRSIAKVYTPSQRAQALECVAKHGPVAASRMLGISRFSLREWQRRSDQHARGERSDSPLAGSDANPALERDQRILGEWRAHPGLGPTQVRNQLRRQGFKVSTHTVRCVMEEHGYVTPKSRRQEAHDQRYEAVRPNQLWHLDFLHRHIHKQPVYTLIVLDDYSRFIVGGAIWDGERAAAVIETFSDAIGRHGCPKMAMSDGGSAFYAWRGISQFTRLLDELEVDQLIATQAPTNGKLEVLNANLAKELFNQETFFDLGEAQRRLKAWIGFYNYRRTHTALGGLLVPADRYFGRADEVLAQIEAGRAPDGLGEPIPVGERQLDLFRIASRGGQLEIHLMGRRIEIPIR